MIIAVQGSIYGNNEASKLLSALAVAGVGLDEKSTLILQFTNQSRKSVERYLIGETLDNESLVKDSSIADVSLGMDALTAHSASQGFTKNTFSEASRALARSNVSNVFDIVVSSRKESFEQEIFLKNDKTSKENDVDFFSVLLGAADSIYELVYVLLPSKNVTLCKAILKYVDVNVICVHQGKAEPVNHGGKRELYIISDYCPGSAYSPKTIAPAYGVKSIFTRMHNVAFNDACTNGTALKFLNMNLHAQQNDANYPFISGITSLYNTIVRNNLKKKDDPDLGIVKKISGPRIIHMPWRAITEPVVIQVDTPKGRQKQGPQKAYIQGDPSQPATPTFVEDAPVYKPAKAAPVKPAPAVTSELPPLDDEDDFISTQADLQDQFPTSDFDLDIEETNKKPTKASKANKKQKAPAKPVAQQEEPMDLFDEPADVSDVSDVSDGLDFEESSVPSESSEFDDDPLVQAAEQTNDKSAKKSGLFGLFGGNKSKSNNKAKKSVQATSAVDAPVPASATSSANDIPGMIPADELFDDDDDMFGGMDFDDEEPVESESAPQAEPVDDFPSLDFEDDEDFLADDPEEIEEVVEEKPKRARKAPAKAAAAPAAPAKAKKAKSKPVVTEEDTEDATDDFEAADPIEVETPTPKPHKKATKPAAPKPVPAAEEDDADDEGMNFDDWNFD